MLDPTLIELRPGCLNLFPITTRTPIRKVVILIEIPIGEIEVVGSLNLRTGSRCLLWFKDRCLNKGLKQGNRVSRPSVTQHAELIDDVEIESFQKRREGLTRVRVRFLKVLSVSFQGLLKGSAIGPPTSIGHLEFGNKPHYLFPLG